MITSVAFPRMVPLTNSQFSNGEGKILRIPHEYSFRLKKFQKNNGNYYHHSISSCLKNEGRLMSSVVPHNNNNNYSGAVNQMISLSTEQKVKDMVLKQLNLLKSHSETSKRNMEQLNEAYGRCRELFEKCSRTFYLGTLVMDPERQRATWAIYAWTRRLDDMVDGRPNASTSTITSADLDRWEERLEDIFRGKPHDAFDAALSDTISKFPIDIQPYKDMIEGMRMDMTKLRYKNFDELYLYCYHVSATTGLMVLPVMGIAPESEATTQSVCNCLVELGVAVQMTNILRDVGEDQRNSNRIYLPQDELTEAGLSDDDVLAGKVTDKWRNFMKKQIKRIRKLFDDGERAIQELSSASRWPMWVTVLINRQILDEIEANDYDNFTRCVSVGKIKKFLTLPIAYAKCICPAQTP